MNTLPHSKRRGIHYTWLEKEKQHRHGCFYCIIIFYSNSLQLGRRGMPATHSVSRAAPLEVQSCHARCSRGPHAFDWFQIGRSGWMWEYDNFWLLPEPLFDHSASANRIVDLDDEKFLWHWKLLTELFKSKIRKLSLMIRTANHTDCSPHTVTTPRRLRKI